VADPKPISLADYRRQRELAAAWEADIAAREKAAKPRGIQPTYLGAEANKVLLAFSDGTEVDLSPAHARTWAERLLGMADVAEAMAKEGGGDA